MELTIILSVAFRFGPQHSVPGTFVRIRYGVRKSSITYDRVRENQTWFIVYEMYELQGRNWKLISGGVLT
jgi:hypothetical protein